MLRGIGLSVKDLELSWIGALHLRYVMVSLLFILKCSPVTSSRFSLLTKDNVTVWTTVNEVTKDSDMC